MTGTPAFETVVYAKANAVAEIRLNRPERLNAVIEQLYDDVLAALDDAEADAGIRVVVLTGEGRAFCVGADLKEHGRGERTDLEKRRYLVKANDVCRRLRSVPKPVIAAVNGYALGAGAELAVSSDFILIKETAQIGFPEISIGTFVGGGVTHLLPRLVGLAKARELIFTGKRINGVEAAAIGLATMVVADARFTESVLAFAQALAGKAPLSMALAKEHLNNASGRDYETALITELEGIRACMTTRDWKEGVEAFAARRPPMFTGD